MSIKKEIKNMWWYRLIVWINEKLVGESEQLKKPLKSKATTKQEVCDLNLKCKCGRKAVGFKQTEPFCSVCWGKKFDIEQLQGRLN